MPNRTAALARPVRDRPPAPHFAAITATLIAVLLVQACTPPTESSLPEVLADGLTSPDWSTRKASLAQLEAFGSAANDQLIAALGDRSDVISKTAQTWLVRQGARVVPELADTLAAVETDRGLFARIAGGTEMHQGKSLAGTLWLTLVRGVPREDCLDQLERLMRNRSPRVRAVAVFAAITLRSSDYLSILEQAATDSDPLVHRRLRQGLVRLLQRGSYSTPRLDAETEGRALDLLEPMFLEAATDQDFGFSDNDGTFADMLGNDRLEHHRDRFVALLLEQLSNPALPVHGQLMIGQSLANQSIEAELAPLVEQLLSGLDEPLEDTSSLPPELVALSIFPPPSWSVETASALMPWLEATREPTSAAARLFLQVYLMAKQHGRDGLDERALRVLGEMLDEPGADAEASSVLGPFLGPWLAREPPAAEPVRALLTPRLDALQRAAETASIKQTCGIAQLFWGLGDARHEDVFEHAWRRRHDATLLDERFLSDCLSFFGWTTREAGMTERLLPYLEEAPTQPHSLVRDSAAAILVGALKRHHASFLDDAVFATWLGILANPEVHPRLRARMTMMLGSPALSEEQDDALRTVLFGLTDPIHDANLRDKILSRLLYQGDLRALPEAYALLTVRDQPHWALSNVISTIPGAGWVMDTAELIEIMDGMVERYGPPDPSHVEIVPSNNYFNWAVQYQVYPPQHLVDELYNRSKEDFGYDADRWRQWLASQNEPSKTDAAG